MAAAPSPVPYQEGKQLDLLVCESYSLDLPPSPRVSATILKMISMTMSPVLEVTIKTRHGLPIRCVLKVYDRRFGTSLRSTLGDSVAAHTRENEAAFQTFVRQGMMPEFVGQLKKTNETDIPIPPRRFLDNSTEGRAKYEAALWLECNEHFQCETKAYLRLADLQGKSIPRMLAYVRLLAVGNKPNSTPADIPPEAASYFEIRGVLLERIDGYTLKDMIATSLRDPPADDLREWQRIIQIAVDAAHEINKRGVIMDDCAPRNVVVHKQSQIPRIIDLAQCDFRDEMAKAWHESEWSVGEDPNVGYWLRVMSVDNPGAIGAVMANRMKREMGVKLDIKYPNCNAIVSRIRREKAEAAASGRVPPKAG